MGTTTDVDTPKHSAIANSIELLDKSLYPDISVVCSTPQQSDKDTQALNPILLVEALSESTANRDRSTKFHHYSRLASLFTRAC
ncbi:MAG: Uma2 family endonuclease [Bacteroidota bacterium]